MLDLFLLNVSHDQVQDDSVLREYADRLAKVFSSPLSPASVPSLSPEWSERAEAAAKGRSGLSNPF